MLEGEETAVVGYTNQGEKGRSRGRDRKVGSLKRTRVVVPPAVQSVGNLGSGNGLVHPDFCLARKDLIFFVGAS